MQGVWPPLSVAAAGCPRGAGQVSLSVPAPSSASLSASASPPPAFPGAERRAERLPARNRMESESSGRLGSGKEPSVAKAAPHEVLQAEEEGEDAHGGPAQLEDSAQGSRGSTSEWGWLQDSARKAPGVPQPACRPPRVRYPRRSATPPPSRLALSRCPAVRYGITDTPPWPLWIMLVRCLSMCWCSRTPLRRSAPHARPPFPGGPPSAYSGCRPARRT